MECRELLSILILIEANNANATRLLTAMTEAGLGTAALTSANDVLSNEITIFTDRVRLDVQTSTPGITFEEAWPRRVTMTYKGQSLEVISLPDLIASKQAAGRDVDLEDVRILQSDVNSSPEDRRVH